MSSSTNNDQYLVLQSKFREGGEELIRQSFSGMTPSGMVWVTNVIQAIEQSAERTGTGQSLGTKAISEFHVVLKATQRSIESGVSIDGGPVVEPPVSVPALRAIIEFYLEKHGATDKAWNELKSAIQVGHMAKKMKGELPKSAKGPSGGSGCALFLLAGIGVISVGSLAGISSFL